MCDCFFRNERPPMIGIGGSQRGFPRVVPWIRSVQILQQVLEGEEWVAHKCLRPVQEDTTVLADNDVPRIKVEVAERIGNVQVERLRADVFQLRPESLELPPRK